MNSIETLKNICTNCERIRGQYKIACPFRSISNEHCEEFNIIKKDLEELEILKKLLKEWLKREE